MLNALNHVLFNFGSDAVTSAEILGFITGLACVYLIVREHIANFAVGIANSVFFLILFLNAAFYADAYLQIVYIVLGFVGWWAWLRTGPQDGQLIVTRASWRWLVAAGLTTGAGTAILTPILQHAHDIAPFWDALTTSLSISAQGLLTFKKFENWAFWIMADLIYIPLYFAKNLYLTGFVYIGFLTLCCVGVTQWWQSRQRTRLVYNTD